VISGDEDRRRDVEINSLPNFDPTSSHVSQPIPIESLQKKIVKINEELSRVHERKGSNFLESLNEEEFE
jgi:hypothetical protein